MNAKMSDDLAQFGIEQKVITIPAVGSHIDGWMSDSELRWLGEISSGMQTVVELGCWKGRSTYALANANGAEPGPVVYAVDHWLGSVSERAHAHSEASNLDLFTTFKKNLAVPIERGAVIPVQSDTVAASKLDYIPDRIDMLFVDGDHDRAAVMRDLMAWHGRTSKVICGHDYNWSGVRAGIAGYLAEAHPNLTALRGPGSIWWVPLLPPASCGLKADATQPGSIECICCRTLTCSSCPSCGLATCRRCARLSGARMLSGDIVQCAACAHANSGTVNGQTPMCGRNGTAGNLGVGGSKV